MFQFKTAAYAQKEFMKEYTKTGGASIGWMRRATWPFAELSATADKLTVEVSILGTYTFTSDQVLSVERYVIVPVLAWGVRIRHNLAEYPEKIIFWCLNNPDDVLNGIRNAGFISTNSTRAS
jgi:hypothetical protein